MPKPFKQQETNLSLEDIRTALGTIEDKALAAEILTHFTGLQSTVETQNNLINEMKERQTELQEQNSKLFTKVSQAFDNDKPDNLTDYTNMVPDLSTIIETGF